MLILREFISGSGLFTFYSILVYFCKKMIKLLFTVSSVCTGNISSDVQGAWTALHPFAMNVGTEHRPSLLRFGTSLRGPLNS